MLVCGAWTLWTGRNARRHGRKVWEPGATVRYISSLLEDLASLKTPIKDKGASLPSVWRGPEEGRVKVNTDAAFDADSCTDSAGEVIRDHKGLVMAAATRWFDKVPDALTAEAMAAKEDLELAVECGFEKTILEVDCSALKTVLESVDGVRSLIGGLCFDITALGRSFDAFKVCWVSRDANSVAHSCASLGSVSEQAQFWFDYIPEWLLGLAAADCNPVSN